MILCHLCGLPIPAWTKLVMNHPLGHSKDHIIPRCRYRELRLRGTLWNQFPAHRCCNGVRGNREITEKLRKRCQRMARREFGRIPGQLLTELGPYAHDRARRFSQKVAKFARRWARQKEAA